MIRTSNLRFIAIASLALLSACATVDNDYNSSGERSGGSSVSASGAFTNDEAQEIVDYHNKVRSEAGITTELKWSDTLAGFAQDWSRHRAESGCNLEHRPANGSWAQRYGENAFMGTAGYFKPIDAAKSWESEKKDYDGQAVSTDGSFYKVGHYTQMIWSSTERIGCGKATCRGQLIVFCNYDPPGNYVGKTPY